MRWRSGPSTTRACSSSGPGPRGPKLVRAPEREGLEALLASTRRWARRALDPLRHDREATIPPRVLDEAAALGLFAITLPEEHGGAGLPLTAACAVIEEI